MCVKSHPLLSKLEQAGGLSQNRPLVCPCCQMIELGGLMCS